MTEALDGLQALAQVRAFLAEQIVPVVPAELASEVRAAMKLVETAAVELNQRQPLVRAELADSAHYCERAARLLTDAVASPDWLATCRAVTDRVERPGLDLRELDAVLRDVRELSSTLLVELARRHRDPAVPEPARAAAGQLAADFCACLGDHARRRLPWQAVFPTHARQGAPHD